MLIAEHTATIEACRFCFMCRHVCTLGVESGKESDTPRGKGLILFKLLKGHVSPTPELIDTLYRCCLCGLCQTWCQAGCTPPAAVLAARNDVVALGREPAAVRDLRDRLLASGNPWGRIPGERFRAIRSMTTAELFRPQAEVLYYVGCETAFDRPEIGASCIALLQAAGVDFTLLSEEHSTGKPLSLLGYRDDARAMAQRLAGQIRDTGCRTLVTACPSALDAFLSDYPALDAALAGVEILHATQYFDRLLEQGRLRPQRTTVASATLLDGTYLGRTHKIFQPPRQILGRLPGVKVLEMAWTRELAHACGESGGVFRLLEPQLSDRLAARVLAEAERTGAAALATTCPTTKTALVQAAPSLAVRDVVELLAEAVGPA